MEERKRQPDDIIWPRRDSLDGAALFQVRVEVAVGQHRAFRVTSCARGVADDGDILILDGDLGRGCSGAAERVTPERCAGHRFGRGDDHMAQLGRILRGCQGNWSEWHERQYGLRATVLEDVL